MTRSHHNAKLQARAQKASLQECQRQAAASTKLCKHYDVAVVGGGPAGLAAAITAAETGASVVIFELREGCGQTILGTGNGRCNFSNVQLDTNKYLHAAFVEEIFGKHPSKRVANFFEDSGLVWTQVEDRLYPASFKAASVQHVLLRRAKAAGVTFACCREVIDLSPAQTGWKVYIKEHFGATNGTDAVESNVYWVSATSVILCTGNMLKQELTKRLGLTLQPLKPLLCPLACEYDPLFKLDGLRAQVRLSLWHHDNLCWQEDGELLVRSYGVSGIVVFNASRMAQAKDTFLVDFVPSLSSDELNQFLVSMQKTQSKTNWYDKLWDTTILDGVIDPRLAQFLILQAQQNASFSSKEFIHKLCTHLKAYPLRILGTHDTKSAQVYRGGLATHELSAQTLEINHLSGLFAAGEAIDVDGPCGGYNLGWAWLSGIHAGKHAAMYAKTS